MRSDGSNGADRDRRLASTGSGGDGGARVGGRQERSDRRGGRSERRRVLSDDGIGGGGGGDEDVVVETDRMVLFWKAPACFAQWTPSDFVVGGVRTSFCTEEAREHKKMPFDTSQTIFETYDRGGGGTLTRT